MRVPGYFRHPPGGVTCGMRLPPHATPVQASSPAPATACYKSESEWEASDILSSFPTNPLGLQWSGMVLCSRQCHQAGGWEREGVVCTSRPAPDPLLHIAVIANGVSYSMLLWSCIGRAIFVLQTTCPFPCSAITVGRVAWVCPGSIASFLPAFVGPWCAALRSVRDDVEKEHALLGLCAMLHINPAVSASGCICGL